MSRLRLRAARAEVHFRLVALGQVLGVESGVDDAAFQVVAVHSGEKVRVDDVGGRAVDDHLLVLPLGVRDRRHVMEHEAAVGVRRFDHRIRARVGCDLDRHLVFHADIQVLLQPLIA